MSSVNFTPWLALTEAAGVVFPHRHELVVERGVGLVEAIGVHRALQVEEVGESGVFHYAVDGGSVGDDDGVERTQPLVVE